MATGNSSGVQRTGADFNTAFVLEALVGEGLLSAGQGQEVAAKEGAARARADGLDDVFERTRVVGRLHDLVQGRS